MSGGGKSRERAAPPRRRGAGRGARGPLAAAALAGLFLAAGLWIYGPALHGPFLSDDAHYLERNPYVHTPSAEHVLAVLNPFGPASRLVENYAPVHLLLHALEWQAFGEATTGYHVVNVALHALASLLVAALLARYGLPRSGALLCGALFLVHPANVEAVAWISQLKSSSALALALLALLAHPARPALGSALFGLALLAKPIAAFALPVAAVRAWRTRGAGAPRGPGRDAWLALWAVLLAAFAVVELAAFGETVGELPRAYPDPGVRLLTSLGIAARYLVLAATGRGAAAFHDPPPIAGPLDPWAAGGVLALALLAARAVWTLRRRRDEAVFWVWAAAAYLPVSQIFPFPFPMADRYLYFVLPGLLGGATLALAEAGSAAARRLAAGGEAGAARLRARLAWGAGAAAVALALVFAASAHQRAALWTSHTRLAADSAAHYPEGRAATLLRARRHAARGDREAALAALERLFGSGYLQFEALLTDPAYAGLYGDPRFRRLLRRMAGRWIEHRGAPEGLTQDALRKLALAHRVRGETEAAERVLERALEQGGPQEERLRRELRALRAGRSPTR